MGAVHTKLVCAPRMGEKMHKSVPLYIIHHATMRERLLAELFRNHLTGTVCDVRAKRKIYVVFLTHRHLFLKKSLITLLHLPALKEAVQSTLFLRIFGKQHQSGSILIQPVYRQEPRNAFHRRQELLTRNGKKAAWLVHQKKLFVLVDGKQLQHKGLVGNHTRVALHIQALKHEFQNRTAAYRTWRTKLSCRSIPLCNGKGCETAMISLLKKFGRTAVSLSAHAFRKRNKVGKRTLLTASVEETVLTEKPLLQCLRTNSALMTQATSLLTAVGCIVSQECYTSVYL